MDTIDRGIRGGVAWITGGELLPAVGHASHDYPVTGETTMPLTLLRLPPRFDRLSLDLWLLIGSYAVLWRHLTALEQRDALTWLWHEPEARHLGLTYQDLDYLVQQRAVRTLFWREMQVQVLEEAA